MLLFSQAVKMGSGRGFASAEKQGDQMYVVRLWQTPYNGGQVWRVSVASRSGERWTFADLSALFTFLRKQTGQSISCDEPVGNGKEDEP
jgi:hypothetical protein